ncbi:hypothetical protein BKA69DRAFT_543914 [Paraphysoderma sedebokerense]|nr:hypothetical protein BKA69DRAFT_543914 [Paraphysoderma sedebokerense]
MGLYVMINFSSQASSLALVGIGINFFQTILILRDFRIKYPPEFHALMDALSIINLNIQLTPPECVLLEGSLGYSLKLRIAVALPLILILLSVLISAAGNRFISDKIAAYLRSRRNDPPQKLSAQYIVIRMVNLILAWIFMSVATNSLALFDCTAEADGHSYLDADPSAKCWVEPIWWADVPLAVAACIIYVAGIPCYFLMLLVVRHQKSRTGPFWEKAREISHQIMRMDRSFRPESQYFTFVQILQKLILVLINMFFTKYTALQVALMIMILVGSSHIYLKYQPYRVRHLNNVELLSGVCSILVLLLGQVYSSPSTQENQKQVITVLILLVISTFILAFLAVGFMTTFQYLRHLACSFKRKMGKSDHRIEVPQKSGVQTDI